jgi:hypothetical protein
MGVRINLARAKWAKRFDECLRESPSAQKSLHILLSHGVNRHVLLDFLQWYTRTNLQPLRTWAGAMARELSKVQLLSRRLADRLEKGLPAFEMGGLTAWQSSRETVAIESLRHTAEYAEDLGKHYKEISNLKGKARNEEILVHLSLTVEAQTGTPHWSDLAYLLEVAFAIRGDDRELWDQDRVRKTAPRGGPG